ncbi:MFS general substrate transporter [Westerdykella ornata]|uniref:MFS general substrate transporter n=1 Tax=Westerdykella ornata TaxID=318751 RepID=A0A6A6JIA6_WESOR|nr:MFS general substrate transporter [Westerdykella ornata]KAF2274989.1 MFS general substrate transporter [Westerdykella ornata]
MTQVHVDEQRASDASSGPLALVDDERRIGTDRSTSPSDLEIVDSWELKWPTDSENPHNWAIWKRIYHVAVPVWYGFTVTFGISVFAPSVSDVTTDLDCSRIVALLGISVFTFGLGFGPIISAPLSERFGRKYVYLVSAIFFMFFITGAALAPNIGVLLLFRSLAGIAGSPALPVAAGTKADVITRKSMALAMSLFMIAPYLGSCLGPVVGGFATQYKGWRWTQWSLLIAAGIVVLMALPMKETYKRAILRNRAIKQRFRFRNLFPPVENTLIQTSVRPIRMLFTEPAVFCFSLYSAYAFAVLFLFFAAFPFVFQRPPYTFSLSYAGLPFLGTAFGVLLGAAAVILIDRKWYQKHVRNGDATPEHRLYSAMYGSIGIPVGLFLFAWSAGKGVHWSVPVVAGVPFGIGNLCLFAPTVLYMIDTYGPMYAASAIAGNGIFRYTLAAVFPLFTFEMYTTMGTAWATTFLGGLSLLMLAIPFVFFKFGARFRAHSKYQPPRR